MKIGPDTFSKFFLFAFIFFSITFLNAEEKTVSKYGKAVNDIQIRIVDYKFSRVRNISINLILNIEIKNTGKKTLTIYQYPVTYREEKLHICPFFTLHKASTISLPYTEVVSLRGLAVLPAYVPVTLAPGKSATVTIKFNGIPPQFEDLFSDGGTLILEYSVDWLSMITKKKLPDKYKSTWGGKVFSPKFTIPFDLKKIPLEKKQDSPKKSCP